MYDQHGWVECLLQDYLRISEMQNLTATMARTEIDSFIVKFKSLLLSGRNATLEIKSNAGKAEVNLRVELGDVSCPPAQHPHHLRPRNGPAKQRRRMRRAAEREVQEAAQATETAKVIAEEATQTVGNGGQAEGAVLPEKDTAIANESEILRDEFCSDESFENSSDSTLVETILVTADCQADWNDNVVTKLVDEKLTSIGICMKSIIVHRNIRRCFESCLVTIEPTKKGSIEKETFPIKRWSMRCVM